MAQMTGGYVPGSAYFDFRQMREADTQSQQRTQLQNLDIARRQMEQAEMQRNLPLLEQQRQLKMGDVGGQLARQPDVLSREAALTGASAAPGRVAADIEGLDLESQAKVRTGKLKQQADEMDTVARALDPVMVAASRGDIRRANDAMEQAFDDMEKAGVPGVAQWRLMPRDQALKQLQGHYNHAINNAPTIRERIKAEAAQKHAMDLERERSRSREKTAAARAGTQDRPGSLPAVAARILLKYGKDEDSLTDSEAAIVQQHFATTFTRGEEAILDGFAPTEKGYKARDTWLKQREEGFKKAYPKIYNRGKPTPVPIPKVGIKDDIKAKATAAWGRKEPIPYDPDKYDYRITETGIERKLKGR